MYILIAFVSAIAKNLIETKMCNPYLYIDALRKFSYNMLILD